MIREPYARSFIEADKSYSLRMTVAPTWEPVTVAQAKAHARCENAAEDALFTAWIKAARELAEVVTGRAIALATYRLTANRFPAWDLKIPKPQLQSISSIAYTDANGSAQTFAGANYTVDTDSEPAIVYPIYGGSWPSTQSVHGAVRVTFTAGYATAADVPEGIKQAIKCLVTAWYEQRETPGITPDWFVSALAPFWTGVMP